MSFSNSSPSDRRRPRRPARPAEEPFDLEDRGGSTPSFHRSQIPSSIGSDGEPRTPRQVPASEDAPIVPPKTEDSDEEMTEERDTWSVEAGELHFTGKPEDLPKVLMHVRLKAALDSDMQRGHVKCAYLASTFRGRALDWFTRSVEVTPKLFNDYDLLESTLQDTFGESEEVRQARAQSKIVHLKHTRTVPEYQAEFESLADELKWPVSARQAFFYMGLKTEIRDRLIAVAPADYTSLKQQAARVEALTTVAHMGQGSTSSSKRKKKKATGKEKCGKCGRTNHKTSECYAKTTVNAIRALGVDDEAAWQYRPIQVENRELTALIDSGSPVSCIREGLVSGRTEPSSVTLQNPDGSALAERARYLTVVIDQAPLRLYVVRNLQEEVILGRDHLSTVIPNNILAINTTGPIPSSGRLRPLSTKEDDALAAFLQTNLERGYVRPSKATNPANILFVPKKNGKLRLCIDYRPLNSVTVKDGYPLPLISDLTDKARGARFFALIDIEEAFYHVKIRPGDEWKTAFKTNRGMYEFTVMPFGVTNGPGTFQRYIDEVLRPHEAYASWYIDDVLIFAESEGQHDERVRAVKQTLAEHEIHINNEKAIYKARAVKFLGMIIHEDRVTADPDVPAIRDWPTPTSRTELQQWLGLANYFRNFLPNFAETAAPLYKLTSPEREFLWRHAEQLAFNATKQAVLQHFATYNVDLSEPLVLYTDASQIAIGAILYQKGRPVAITSRSLTPAERNYNTTERELLPIVHAAKKWRHLFESTNQPITVLTDHKAITQGLNAAGTNRRINRWVEILQPYKLVFEHVDGPSNPADYPSRRPDYEHTFGGRGGGELGLYESDEDTELRWNGYPLMQGTPVGVDNCDHWRQHCCKCARWRKTVKQWHEEAANRIPGNTSWERVTDPLRDTCKIAHQMAPPGPWAPYA